jgi:hypothetical protein
VSLGVAGFAAWLALTWRAALRPGESVLVLGASGVVGQIAVQAGESAELAVRDFRNRLGRIIGHTDFQAPREVKRELVLRLRRGRRALDD